MIRKREGARPVPRWTGFTLTAIALLFAIALPAVVPGTAVAGTVRFFPDPMMELPTPDTRGGMIMDDKYVWIAHHARGLWRVDRCTGANAAIQRPDGKAWDLAYYDPFGNYPEYPDPDSPNPSDGYFIYLAGANGTVYIYNTASPSVLAGSVATGGGVAYGVYATDPTQHMLYVATTGGLMAYDISNPTNPIPVKALGLGGGPLLPTLDFISVKGMEGHGYVYANSFTDNKTYVIRVSDNTVVSSIAYGGSNTLRRMWVHTDSLGRVYVYAVNNSGDLWITDVTIPAAPNLITYWNSPAGGPANMPGGSVYVQKDYAFVLTSNGNDQGYIYMLDVRNPYNPVVVDVLYDPAFGFNDLRLDGREIHVAAHDGWKMYFTEGWETDAKISNWDTSNFVGEGIVSIPTTTQVKSQIIDPGEDAVFQVMVQNKANRRDRIQLVGTFIPGWETRYIVEGSDVTTDVLSGTYASRYLDPAEYLAIELRMTPTTAAPGTPYESPLTAYSWMSYGSDGT